nr:hypothetical protein [Candidatus Bathyarchaeota archaeon]
MGLLSGVWTSIRLLKRFLRGNGYECARRFSAFFLGLEIAAALKRKVKWSGGVKVIGGGGWRGEGEA